MHRLLACLAVALLLAAPVAHAKQCKSKAVTGISTGATKLAILSKHQAKAAAWNHWIKRCAQLYPDVWCDREIASRKNIKCNRQPNGLSGYNHNCEFSARPCRN